MKPVLHVQVLKRNAHLDVRLVEETIKTSTLSKDYHVIVTDLDIDVSYPYSKKMISSWEKKMQTVKIGLMAVFLIIVIWYLLVTSYAINL